MLLRSFGARVGKRVKVRPTARITYPWNVAIGDDSWIGDNSELYSLGSIVIGRSVVISQRAYICTGSHDISRPSFDQIKKPVVIEDEAWVAACAFVYPGVTVRYGSVVAACSVLRSDTDEYGIYRGNPATKTGVRRFTDAAEAVKLAVQTASSSMGHPIDQ